MLLKQGYKLTELGVIPEDWDLMALRYIAKYRRGSFPQPYGLRKWYDDVLGNPFIQVFDIDDNLRLKPETKKRLSKEAEKMSVFAKKGSVVLTINGSLGRVALTQYDGYIDRTLLIFEKFYIPIDKHYFTYSVFALFQIEKEKAPGAILKTITKKHLSNFLLPVPTIAEQSSIAEALSDVDALITSLDDLIAKKRATKQGAIQVLLTGKARLPGFTSEWDHKSLGNLFLITAGMSKSKYIVEYGQYLIVDMGSISINGKLIALKQTDYCGDFLEYGDLVMPKDDIGGGNIIGKAAFIDKDKKYIYGDHIYILKSKLGDPYFLSLVINSFEINQKLRKKVSGSAQLGLSRKSVEEEIIVFPSLEEQKSIAKVFSEMESEISFLEQKRDKTKALKQGMMQELLTGRIRLMGG